MVRTLDLPWMPSEKYNEKKLKELRNLSRLGYDAVNILWRYPLINIFLI